MMLNDELIQHTLEFRFNRKNMPENDDEGESSHVVDMSYESTQAMATMRDEIVLPLWAHSTEQ